MILDPVARSGTSDVDPSTDEWGRVTVSTNVLVRRSRAVLGYCDRALSRGWASEVRRIMSDNLADGGLIDVSALSLSELLEEVDESSLASALERILAAQQEEGHHGFNANI
jgi:hypothetical protein